MRDGNARHEDEQVERNQIMQAFVHASLTQHTYRDSANYEDGVANGGAGGRKDGLFYKQYDKSKQLFRKKN